MKTEHLKLWKKKPNKNTTKKTTPDTKPQTLLNHFWSSTEFCCFSYFFFYYYYYFFSDTDSWLWSALLDKYLVAIESSVFYEILFFFLY